MSDYLRRCVATVDLDAIGDNYRALQDFLTGDAKVMAVLKANGYGHGDGYTARALQQAGVDYFAVSNVEEAVSLRHHGITADILIMCITPPEQLPTLTAYNIVQTVYDYDYAKELSDRCHELRRGLRVHIKVDTGMERIGVPWSEHIGDDVKRMLKLTNLEFEGLYTHFSSADDQFEGGTEFTRMQFERFKSLYEGLEEEGVFFPIKHCCNTSAALFFPDMHLDYVRAGIALYGYYPAPQMADIVPLRPSMEFKAYVSMVKTVEPGALVSYGRTFEAEREMKLATVSVGYADGYSRSLSNRGRVLIGGQFAPIVGRVCMDQLVCDVSHIDDVQLFDEAILFGQSRGVVLPIEELAELQGTITYEIMCGVGKRVTRVYCEGGREVGFVEYTVL